MKNIGLIRIKTGNYLMFKNEDGVLSRHETEDPQMAARFNDTTLERAYLRCINKSLYEEVILERRERVTKMSSVVCPCGCGEVKSVPSGLRTNARKIFCSKAGLESYRLKNQSLRRDQYIRMVGEFEKPVKMKKCSISISSAAAKAYLVINPSIGTIHEYGIRTKVLNHLVNDDLFLMMVNSGGCLSVEHKGMLVKAMDYTIKSIRQVDQRIDK